VGFQAWATLRLLDEARTWLFPLYSSLLTPLWLRLLGARVGRDVEASTVLLLPSLTTVGDGAFLADDTMVGAYELNGGWLRVESTKIGKRAFLGNSGMTAPGRRVRKHGLVAVLSAAPERAKPGSSWLGSPPVRLRRSEQVVDESRTFAPARRLVAARALVEAGRLVPVVLHVALLIGVLVCLAGVGSSYGWGRAALAAGPVLLLAGALAALLATAAKWLLVGRIRAAEVPLWSSFVWRNELADTFVEVLAARWFTPWASATPLLSLWLRSLGARIGRGVWCDSYWLPEADLVDVGAGATVERGCVLQTHLFHDRVLSTAPVVLGAGATVGPHGVVLPAAVVGAGTTVGPASLVVRGDHLPQGTRWLGNPVAPWHAS
jgi:non-ribosomal peptide synthetase-like protein